MKKRFLILLAATVLCFAGCSNNQPKESETKTEDQKQDSKTDKVEPVDQKKVYVSSEWIQSVIKGEQPESENYMILETSTTEDSYKEGHIPGAYHLDVHLIETSTYAAYADNTIDYTNGNLGNLVSPEELTKVMNSYGITKDTTVILYGGHPSTEREAFALLYCGVENVKVLDGSIETWKKAGFEVETTVNEPKPNTDFGCEIPAHPEYVMTKEELKDKLANDTNFKLVSVRSLDEFKGLSDGNYPMLQEKGEIAGAVFGRAGSDANLMEEYMTEEGTVIPYETFKEFMADSNVTPDNEVCFYCGTGWRATMPLLLGYEKGWDVKLYDGGWWEWTRDLKNNEIQMLTPEQAKTCSRFEYVESEITLKVGDANKEVNSVKIFPASGTLPTVRFKSDNTDVVTVDETGKVTAVGEGTATVKMIATDFSGRNTSYKVTVEK